jgi:hypothetical protein
MALKNINLENVKVFGEECFAYAGFDTTLDLSSATYIGKYAFAYSQALPGITLGEGACTIDAHAFSHCNALATVTNLNKVTVFGDYAFAYTAVTDLDLTAATSIGAHAFIKEVMTPVTVVLGANLETMGDNPFAMCEIAPFQSEILVGEFNGSEYKEITYNYHISDSIYVIEGSLYRVVPNGLELITFAGTSDRIAVAKDTVRISAMAFAGVDVKEVVLPSTLVSIGHKAFYGCEKLKLVTFTSYNAPNLEEEFDQLRYYSCDFFPGAGDYEILSPDGATVINKPGMEIVPYYMWNVSSQPASIFYGANFIDYVGEVEQKITMIRPSNGKNYDSFIFGQYFDTIIDGASAADAVTLYAISLIEKIPEKVTLKDKALIEAARAAYNQISTLEQQSLVTKLYSKLTAAEKRISDLEFLQQDQNPVEPPVSGDEKTPLTSAQVWNIVLGILVGVMTLTTGTFAVLYFMPNIKALLAKMKEKKQAQAEEATSAPVEEGTEPTAGDTTDDTSEGV